MPSRIDVIKKIIIMVCIFWIRVTHNNMCTRFVHLANKVRQLNLPLIVKYIFCIRCKTCCFTQRTIGRIKIYKCIFINKISRFSIVPTKDLYPL